MPTIPVPKNPLTGAPLATPNVADLAGLSGPISMAAEVTPLIPKGLDALSTVTKHLLRKAGLLGFDSMSEAMTAIRQHPDWATRWDVDATETPIIEAWRKAHLLAHPPQATPWDLIKQSVREQLRATAPAKPSPPSLTVLQGGKK